MALNEEKRYREEGVYAPVVDLTLLDDDSEDEIEVVDDVGDMFDDSDDDASDVYDD